LLRFEPLFRNPHLATLAGNFWRRRMDEARFPTQVVETETEPGTRVRILVNRPRGAARGEVFLEHGLEGSSGSGYMVSLAQALCEAGWVAHRVNMRSCGGSEHLTRTLYHSGLTADLRRLLERARGEGRGPLFAVGFSLGGNLVLKLAGELGAGGGALLDGVATVSAPLDLHLCVERIGAWENRLYEKRFVRSLKRRYERRHRAEPERFPSDGLGRVRTIFEFDDRFTAPHFGFADALEYYRTQSSLGFLPSIRVPTLLVQAEDDPMIPFALYRRAEVQENKWIRLVSVPHGGHLGFIARRRPRFWLDPQIVEWVELVRNNGQVWTV
jgi:predicted alpha/beta-fold hydrolase